MKPISIYIPCHNAESYIARCLDSILIQTIKPIEILIIDDGSNDKTIDIATKYPVEIIRLPSHPGLAAARNAAIKAARGEFVASLDADCIPEPRWLENLAKNLEDGRVAGAGGMLVENYREKPADRWRAVHMRQNWGVTKVVNPPFLFGCNTLFRKSALEEVGLYDERFSTNGEDVDISFRLRGKNYSLVYDPSSVVRHLKRDTISSVLKADWRWGYSSSGDTEKYKNTSRIVYHNFTNAKFRFLQDISLRRHRLLPIDILLLFFHTYFDLLHRKRLRAGATIKPHFHEAFDTLTSFHSHLEKLSGSRFLRSPSAIMLRDISSGKPPRRILFALFGAMGDVFNALPVVRALREKYPGSHITWMTLPRHREIAECPWVDEVITCGTGRHGESIPLEQVASHDYDLVFFPQGSFNHDEWQQSGLHMIDFMARKCGVTLTSRAPEVDIDEVTKAAVDDFWRENSLHGKKVIAIACTALSCGAWPLENFIRLAKELLATGDVALVQLGGDKDTPLPGALNCRNLPLKRGIETISRCDLYIGCDSGPSWMASCTSTPMIVFMDAERRRRYNVGFKCVMPEKDISELPIEVPVNQVLMLLRKRLSSASGNEAAHPGAAPGNGQPKK